MTDGFSDRSGSPPTTMTSLADVICPKCGAMNSERKVQVEIVEDERGRHADCAVCSHSTPLEKDHD